MFGKTRHLLPTIGKNNRGRGKRICQSLAILAFVCQTLATSGCTSYSAAIDDIGAASRQAIAATPGYAILPAEDF